MPDAMRLTDSKRWSTSDVMLSLVWLGFQGMLEREDGWLLRELGRRSVESTLHFAAMSDFEMSKSIAKQHTLTSTEP